MLKYQYIRTNTELIRFRNYLQSDKIETLAIDFEGEFSLHQYGETLCLIQVFDGKSFYIIDPFKIDAIEIRNLLEMKDIVKIFYDAQSDKALVFKQYDIDIMSIFDLIDLVHILEGNARGLDAMIEKYLGITVSQKKKFQKHNWTLRPISDEAIQYALQDVQYLFQLKEILLKQVTDKNLIEDYLNRLVKKDNRVKINPIPGVKRKREYKKLSQKQKIIFDIIFDIRDKYARKLNWPPNNVISNTLLHQIAKGIEPLEKSIHPKVPRSSKERMIRDYLDKKTC